MKNGQNSEKLRGKYVKQIQNLNIYNPGLSVLSPVTAMYAGIEHKTAFVITFRGTMVTDPTN